MTFKPGFLLLLAIMVFSIPAVGQKILALENPTKFKRIVFRQGDYIRFATSDSQAKFSGRIESINDSVIVIVKVVKIENEGDATNNVFRDFVLIRDITKVFDQDRNWWDVFRNMYSGTAVIGGGALVLVAIVNSVIEDVPPDPNSIILASSISASGLLLRYLGRNHYKIGKRWQLRAMEPFDPAGQSTE